MEPLHRQWMEYADREVRAACDEIGYGHQLRRKWTVREKPLNQSDLADYEWKLLPKERGRLPDLYEPDFDGTYFLLSIDRLNRRFLFQHDTHQEGALSRFWETVTFTTIGPPILPYRDARHGLEVDGATFPEHWLHRHVVDLVKRFRPNTFSTT